MSWPEHDHLFPPISVCLDFLESVVPILARHGVQVGSEHMRTITQLKELYPPGCPPARGMPLYLDAQHMAPSETARARDKDAWNKLARESPWSIVFGLVARSEAWTAELGADRLGTAAYMSNYAGFTFILLACVVRCALQAPPAKRVQYIAMLKGDFAERIRVLHEAATHEQPPPTLGACPRACLVYVLEAYPDERIRAAAMWFLALK